MGTQDQQAALTTNIVNDAMQQVSNQCTITCSDNISNVSQTIIGGSATINISQTCSVVGAECSIKNLIQSQISNLIKNIVKQEQSNMGIFSLFGPSSSTNTNISNSIKSQVSQLISNVCNIDSGSNIVNYNLFAQDADINLNITQGGNANKATCALDTVAKLVLNNSVQNSVTQSQSSCKDIVLILIIVAIIVILILLMPILGPIFETVGAVLPKKKKKN
jgi:hypothetical protein